jgi:hypothetical protein
MPTLYEEEQKRIKDRGKIIDDAFTSNDYRELLRIWDRDYDKICFSNQVFLAACRHGSLDFVKLVLSYRESAGEWRRGLEEAAFRGHLDVVTYIVTNGNIPRYHTNILAKACSGGHVDVVEFLVERGFAGHDYSLLCAAQAGHLPIVKRMVKLGVSTVLEAFRRTDNKEIAEYLISTELDEVDAFLRVSCARRRYHCIDILLNKGAKPGLLLEIFLYPWPERDYVSIYRYYSKLLAKHKTYGGVQAAVQDLCDIVLTLQHKRLPNLVIYYKILPYL